MRYENRRENALKNVSFKVIEGEHLGIIGESGSGKSSIIQLLLRFYPIQEEEILIDGKNIKDFDIHHLRQAFGVVIQEPPLFNESI